MTPRYAGLPSKNRAGRPGEGGPVSTFTEALYAAQDLFLRDRWNSPLEQARLFVRFDIRAKIAYAAVFTAAEQYLSDMGLLGNAMGRGAGAPPALREVPGRGPVSRQLSSRGFIVLPLRPLSASEEAGRLLPVPAALSCIQIVPDIQKKLHHGARPYALFGKRAGVLL